MYCCLKYTFGEVYLLNLLMLLTQQRLRFGWPIADILRFTNSFTYLLTLLVNFFVHVWDPWRKNTKGDWLIQTGIQKME